MPDEGPRPQREFIALGGSGAAAPIEKLQPELVGATGGM